MTEGRLRRTVKKSLICFTASTVLISNIFWTIPANALGGVNLNSSIVTRFINEYGVNIAPGVSEKRYIYEDMEGKRTEAFVVHVDMKNPMVSIEAATPNDADGYSMQTVREQAGLVSEEGHSVVAAVNGDYYNMATGEPFGIVYKEGRAVRTSQFTSWKFFAITKDGKAIIGDINDYMRIKDQIKEALGGQAVLVKNGQVYETSPFNAGRNPRTGVGIKADGNVFFITIDGRQAPYSSGITCAEFAQLMIDLGAETALDLDGGGSTTYISRKPGEDDLQLVNSPSGGAERKVANSWLIVSTAQPDHAFDSAFIEPYDKSYTPGSTVQFSFKGRDRSLASADEPSYGLSWELSDWSFGSIDYNGKFISNGKTGEVMVSLKYFGQTVGNTWIEIHNPDNIQFASTNLSIISGSKKPLNLTAAFDTRILNLKPEDIEWDYPSGLGNIDENGVFHAGDNLVTGRVTARYKGTTLEDTIDVTIVRKPEVLFGFEDGQNWKTSIVGRGEAGSVALSSDGSEPVRFDKHALKIGFDFTGAQTGTTLGVYAGPGSRIPVPGNPKSIGMWVYAGPEAKGYWLRMALVGGNDTVYNLNLTQSSPGIDWTGWKYVEASVPSGITEPLYIHPDQAIRIMSTNSGAAGPMTKGSIYVDKIRAIYGENSDDLYAPVIESINVDGKVYNTGYVAIEAKIHDYDGGYYNTGVNWDNVKILVDRKEYTATNSNFSYNKTDGTMALTGLWWRDGAHETTVIAQDNFGNESSKTVSFTVNTD